MTTVVTEAFAETNPEDTARMRKVPFAYTRMGGLPAWQKRNSTSGEDAAVCFLRNGRDVRRSALNEEARDNRPALLQ